MEPTFGSIRKAKKLAVMAEKVAEAAFDEADKKRTELINELFRRRAIVTDADKDLVREVDEAREKHSSAYAQLQKARNARYAAQKAYRWVHPRKMAACEALGACLLDRFDALEKAMAPTMLPDGSYPDDF
jgi:hypothetical protein